MKAWLRHPGILGLGFAILALASAAPVLGQQASYYVLDGFGGVHAGGGAPAIPGTPYFGFDIAKGIAYAPGASGNGIMVLDGFGGVHRVGLGSAVAPTPYFGFNIARAITYRNVPPRIANSAATVPTTLFTNSVIFTTVRSVVIFAPDDGFLLVMGSASVACFTSVSGYLSGQLAINVDATNEPAAIPGIGLFQFRECGQFGGALGPAHNQTLTHVFPVTAGAHTVNLLVRKNHGTDSVSLNVLTHSLTALFIDHNAVGAS
jgi:hypothetical protein